MIAAQGLTNGILLSASAAEEIARVIPSLTRRDGEKYTDVVLTRKSEDKVTFEHQGGLATLPITAFDDANLDRLFPGHTAGKQAAEEALRHAQAEQMQWEVEERKLAEANLQKALVQVLHGSQPNDVVKAIVVTGHQSYVLGQVPIILARLVNTSPQTIYLLRRLDGSEGVWLNKTMGFGRFPGCDLEFRDSKGSPADIPRLRCGNVNRLQATDFVAVEPGEVFDPFGPRSDVLPIKKPGDYTVRFVYTTRQKEIEWYRGHQGMTDLLWMFEKMPKVDLRSLEIRISFTAPRPDSARTNATAADQQYFSFRSF